MPVNDTIMDQPCIKVTRSAPSFQNLNCQSQERREQLNLISSYFDLSQVYGIDLKKSLLLRSFINGTLLTSQGASTNRPYLPKSPDEQCDFENINQTLRCFMAGNVLFFLFAALKIICSFFN